MVLHQIDYNIIYILFTREVKMITKVKKENMNLLQLQIMALMQNYAIDLIYYPMLLQVNKKYSPCKLL